MKSKGFLEIMKLKSKVWVNVQSNYDHDKKKRKTLLMVLSIIILTIKTAAQSAGALYAT